MGDGIVRRYAVIINGTSQSGTFQYDIEAGLSTLNDEGFTTYVAAPEKANYIPTPRCYLSRENVDPIFGPECIRNPQKPRNPLYNFDSDRAGINRLLDELKKRIDDDDELVVYVSGYGKASGFCIDNDCATNDIYQRINELPFGKRTVILDTGFGGNQAARFLNHPKTLFISASSEDMLGTIGSSFWTYKPERKMGGDISFGERFAHVATDTNCDIGFPMFLSSSGYKDRGEAPFKNRAVEVQNGSALNEMLKRLRPGQYAMIIFAPSPADKHDFERQAKEDGGQHLFLITENVKLAKSYGVTSFPTALIIDHRGVKRVARNRQDLSQDFAKFRLTADEIASELRKHFFKPGRGFNATAIHDYQSLSSKLSNDEVARGATVLRKMLGEPDWQVRSIAARAYGVLGPKLSRAEAEEGAKALRKLLTIESHGIEDVIYTYASLVPKLSSAEAEEGSKAFLDIYRQRRWWIRGAVVASYEPFIMKVGRTQLTEAIEALRTLFDYEFSGTQNAARRVHSMILKRLAEI